MAWYDPDWLYRQKITIDHTLIAEDLTDFPVLITDATVQASLFVHARSDGADIVLTAGDETTGLKRELVTYDAIAGELELLRQGPEPVGHRYGDLRPLRQYRRRRDERCVDTWNANYGIVYRLKEDPAGTAPQAKDSTANAVNGTYDIAGAIVEADTSGVAGASSSKTARVCVLTMTRRGSTR